MPTFSMTATVVFTLVPQFPIIRRIEDTISRRRELLNFTHAADLTKINEANTSS
jgi:hypothetical protein